MGKLTHDQKLVKLLRETKRICELHGIKYFLIGGSLRGAVVCEGCIPGDTDIDIGMLRSDYIHFLSCLDELAPEYTSKTYMNDAAFKETFAKILDDTENAYIDIQPFDNAAKSKILRFFHWFLFKVSRRLAVAFQSRKIKLCANLFLKMQIIIQEFFNQEESEGVVSLNSRHGYKEFFVKTELEKLSEVMFEGIICPAPRNPKAYLSSVYGQSTLPTFRLSKKQLTLIQKCHLDLLCEVRRICEKNDIHYFITDGTLLGAIKYKRAIPWDDDADIGMLKADYDRFMKACETHLGSEYCLNNYHTEPKYGNSFAELCIKDTICRKATDPEYGDGRNGIFIDIHPFINIPENKAFQWLFSRICKYYKIILMLKCGYHFRSASKRSQSMIGLLSKLYSRSYLISRIESLSTKYKDTELAAQVFGHRYTRNNVFVENINKLAKVEYNGLLFPAQPDYDRILKAVYGESYMAPIKMERIQYSLTSYPTGSDLTLDMQGGRHGIMELNLGRYVIKNNN